MNEIDTRTVSAFLAHLPFLSDEGLSRYAAGLTVGGDRFLFSREVVTAISAAASEEIALRGPVPRWKFVRSADYTPSYPEQVEVIERAESEEFPARGMTAILAETSRRYDLVPYLSNGTYFLREDYGVCRTVGRLVRVA